MDDSKFIIRKVVIDFIILCCVGFPILFFYLWGVPFQRGFFCDDESLRHPFHDSTVTNTMLYIIGLLFPVLLMLVTEIVRFYFKMEHRQVMGYSIPSWVWNSYVAIGVFGFGAACSQLTTDIAKYSIGRLRPHFIDVCKPNINCSDPLNQYRYITDFTCLGTDKRLIRESRLSFPSGHSSFSMYTMLYCAIYLQSRMKWRGVHLLRHFLQFLLLMMTWYTCLSRISDYKHHWSDVLSGGVIGLVVAIIIAKYVSTLFPPPASKYLPEPLPYQTSAQEMTRPRNGSYGAAPV